MELDVKVAPLSGVTPISDEQLADPEFDAWWTAAAKSEGSVKVLLRLNKEMAYRFWRLRALVPMDDSNAGVVKAAITAAFEDRVVV
jgi:hypothetical protein